MAQEAGHISEQLTRVRRRGIDDLDINKGNKTSVHIEELEQLSADYCRAKAPHLRGRRPQITRLLTDGLVEYELSGNLADARFIRGLFFAEGARMNSTQASRLLNQAKWEHEKMAYEEKDTYDPRSFDAYRSITFEDFASFLVDWSSSI